MAPPNATEQLEKEWAEKGKPYRRTSKPYRSTFTIPFDVSDSDSGVAYLSLPAGLVLTCFDFGLGDEIPDGFGGQRKANLADTNLARAGYTNGDQDFAIESMSLTSVGFRVRQAMPTKVPGNKTVKDAYDGKAAIVDPASLLTPPQLMSPFNLEDAVFSRLIKLASLTFVWDQGDRTIPMGALDEIPEGGANSFLRANGEPHPSSRYRIAEGFKWGAAGDSGSQFACQIRIERALVVPLTLIKLPGEELASLPTAVCLDVAMRAHGVGFSSVSQN